MVDAGSIRKGAPCFCFVSKQKAGCQGRGEWGNIEVVDQAGKE